MRITDITWVKVRVPCRPDSVNSPPWGVDAWESIPRFIIQVHTDEGIVGLGETPRGVSEEAVRAAAQRLQGQDPFHLCWQDLPLGPDMSAYLVGWNSTAYPPRPYELTLPPGPAYVAFESAIFDIVGKALGLPVHRLLGSACRSAVPVDFWMGRRTPEDAARRTRLAVSLGYRGLKMKSALEDPVVAQVEAIVEAGGPDFRIIIDPNQRYYRPAEALRLARDLERFPQIVALEDPVPVWNLDWYRLLRQKTTIPLALHLSTPQQVINAIKAEACDYLNLGGGMVNFVKCAAIAEAAGILVWHGSGVDLGILEASYVHAAAVARTCVLPSDIFGRLIREHDLLVEPLRIENGQVVVPQRPGLGVDLDLDAVERYRVRE